jgi:hypothetical protein
MTTPIFSKNFYSEFYSITKKEPHYFLKDGTICVSENPKRSVFHRIRSVFCIDTDLLAVGNRLREIENQCQQPSYDDLRNEIHQAGWKGYTRLLRNIESVRHTIVAANQGNLLQTLLSRIVNIFRKVFAKPPLQKRQCSFIQDMNAFTKFAKKSLAVTDTDKKKCSFFVDVISGDQQKLYSEKLHKLECGLRKKPIYVKSGNQRFTISYDKCNKLFFCSYEGPVINECYQACKSWKPSILPWKIPSPLRKKHTTIVREDDRQITLKCITSASFSRNSFSYAPPLCKHPLGLVPGKLYSLESDTDAAPLKFYIRKQPST